MSSRSCRSRLLLAVLGCLSAFGGVQGLKVITPAAGDDVIAERTYTVEWTHGTSGDRRFDIDLYYCGSACSDSYCGDLVASLCSEDGCPDSAGDKDVKFPEPAGGVTSDGYVVRVADTEDEDDVDCSDSFRLVASEEVPLVGEDGGPVLKVLLPVEGDEVYPGDEYTVKFEYDDGLGSSKDRFSIDLYDADTCGTRTPVAMLCEKPEVGCRITDGDYEITIPSDTPAGSYAVQVARFETGSPADCSESFEVLPTGSAVDDTSSSTDDRDDGDDATDDTDDDDDDDTTSDTDDADDDSSSAVSGNAITSTSSGSSSSTPEPVSLSNGDDDSTAATCSVVDVEADPDAVSDYSGTYAELGKASGKPRFVRDDNIAILQYVKWDGDGHWVLTGLQTTLSVVSDADHPADAACDTSSGSDCWEEQTESGKVPTSVEMSCSDDSVYDEISTPVTTTTTTTSSSSASLLSDGDDAEGETCRVVEVEVDPDAVSDYSGTYEELGTASGKPRFVRDDNAAIIQSVDFDGEEHWLLTGLQTTFSVASDADHPMDITCKRQNDCWKEQTDSGQIVSSAEISCSSGVS